MRDAAESSLSKRRDENYFNVELFRTNFVYIRTTSCSRRIAIDSSVEFDVRIIIGFKLAGTAVHRRWCAAFARVIRDRELRRGDRRGREGKGRYSLFYKSRPRGAQREGIDGGWRRLRRAVKIRVLFFFFGARSAPPSARPLCISMHRRALQLVRIAPRMCRGRDTRVSRGRHSTRSYNLPVRERRYKRGAAPNDLSRVSIDCEISRGRDLPANRLPFSKHPVCVYLVARGCTPGK